MSSILTNLSAMSALQTLQSINKDMETTQNHISSGLRVETASDNAAYWSIATTMRSDNKALSTISDALGLGSATVNVAYTAMSSTKDVLDNIKTKLIAATQPGVDKSKIQAEIKTLQDSIKSIADSASFSGSNWLSVDSGSSSYKATQSVVSSFTRSDSGAISLGTVDINVGNIALFDKSATTSGLLEAGVDAGVGNSSAATLATATATGTAAIAATAGALTTSAYTWTQGDAVDGDDLVLTFKFDGGAATDVTLDIPDAAAGLTGTELETALNADATFSANATAVFDAVTNKFTFTSKTTGTTSNVEVTAAKVTQNATPATVRTATTGLGAAAGTAGAAGTAATAGKVTLGTAFGSAVTLDSDDTIAFDIAVDGGAAKTVTISKATVDAALSSTDGKIADATAMQSVLTQALTDAGVSGVTVGVGSGADANKLTFTSGTTGATSSVALSNVKTSNGDSFSVLAIDISTATGAQLDNYIKGVEGMISKVTAAASDLGATKSRIETQDDFVGKLMDAIDSGISKLVDADMEEESTRLKALQTQQQLGVQSLSIANSSAQNILSLFR